MYGGGVNTEARHVTAFDFHVLQYRTPNKKQEKAGLGWISYLRMGGLYTNFSIITTPEFLVFLYNISLPFLSARSLIINRCQVSGTAVSSTCTTKSSSPRSQHIHRTLDETSELKPRRMALRYIGFVLRA